MIAAIVAVSAVGIAVSQNQARKQGNVVKKAYRTQLKTAKQKRIEQAKKDWFNQTFAPMEQQRNNLIKLLLSRKQ